MPKYQQDLRDICSNADSKRVLERRKWMVKLHEIYQCQAAIDEINEYSSDKNESGITWTMLLHAVHTMLLHEADQEKAKQSKQSSTPASHSRLKNQRSSHYMSEASTLMLETVKRANSCEIFLKGNDLMSIILQILSNQSYDNYHRAYFAMLLYHLLPIKQYQTEMTLAHWKELLNLCINLYQHITPGISKESVLDAILQIIRYGSIQSELILKIKKILPFLVQVVSDAKLDPRTLSERTFQLLNETCQQMSTESRTALCEFGETALPHVIAISGGPTKYDWILLVFRAHHPGGATKHSDSAFACDWEKWSELTRSIYQMVINDCQSEFSSESFVQLACEVSWQLNNDSLSPIDDSLTSDTPFAQTPKRRKSVIGIQGMIDMVTMNHCRDLKLCVEILITMIKWYPSYIHGRNFLLLMQYLIDGLNNCKKDDVIKRLWELGDVIVETESKLSNNSMKTEESQLLWDKICDITLRSVGMNQRAECAHVLLQSLIEYKKISNSSTFLDLYLKDAVQWSQSSIRSLLLFCRNNKIDDDIDQSIENGLESQNVPVKIRLLKWVLNIPAEQWNSGFPIDNVCELMVGLTLKSWYIFDESTTSHMHRSFMPDISAFITNPRQDITNVENIYLMTAFDGSLREKSDTTTKPHQQRCNENISYTRENRNLLISDLIEKITLSGVDPLHPLVLKTTLICKAFSSMKYLNVIHHDVKDDLGDIIEQSFQDISSFDVALKTKNNSHYIFNVLESLHLLYKTSYDKDISNIIQSSTDVKMLKRIVQLIQSDKDNDSTDENDETSCTAKSSQTNIGYIKNIQDLSQRRRFVEKPTSQKVELMASDIDQVRLKALEMLIAFSHMSDGTGMSKVQERLQITLLNPENYELTENVNLKIALTLLDSLIGSASSRVSDKVIDGSLKLLQKLCRIWHKDSTAVAEILKCLSKMFPHLKSVGSDVQRQNSLRILTYFHKFLTGLTGDKQYGPQVHIAFVQCLGTLAKVDPDFEWTIWNELGVSAETTPVVQSLLTYVQSPFHVVRIETIKCLYIIFSSRVMKRQWQQIFFTRLIGKFDNLFIVKGNLVAREKEDERANRIATAMHVLAVVMLSNAVFTNEALLELFKLTVDKNVNTSRTKKLLEGICSSLKMEMSQFLQKNTMNYLMTNWFAAGYSLSRFPWDIFFPSEGEFCKKYIDVIAFVLIQRGEYENAQILCENMNENFENVVEGLVPQILAWLLPYVSVDSRTLPAHFEIVHASRANKTWHYLTSDDNNSSTLPKIAVLVKKNLEHVVLYLVKELHDEQHFAEQLDIAIDFPSPNPPAFLHEDIVRAFEYLQRKILRIDSSLVHCLVTENRHVLQKILLDLKQSIHDANSIEHKLKALHHYVYFATMLVSEINQIHFHAMATFVVRDISYTLINLIKDNYSKPMTRVACCYFYFFVRKFMPKQHEEIQRNLKFIVSTLLSVENSEKIPRALDILRFLIVDQNDILSDAIQRLDSFPQDESFDEIRGKHFQLQCAMNTRNTLKAEIDYFLEVKREQSMQNSSAELLKLHEKLATQKLELSQMYRDLESRQTFSEDCAASKLHQLICTLVKLTMSSQLDVALAATKCLGELGPADLTTMILQPGINCVQYSLDPMMLFVYQVIVMLSNFLIHADINLISASSDALYVILATTWGQKLTRGRNLDDIQRQLEDSQEPLRLNYIIPFVAHSKNSDNVVKVHIDKFKNSVGQNNELWMGPVKCRHADWVVNFACGILSCFSNSCFEYLIPVCRANAQFCEKILPWIINLLVTYDEKLKIMVHDNLNQFFEYHFANSQEFKNNSTQNNLLRNICFDHESVQCMLNVVSFLRLQSTDYHRSQLNFLHIAEAAQYCSAYFTSILYAELWCEPFLQNSGPTKDLSVIDYICEVQPENGRALQNILRKACVKIGDPDAIYGCGSSFLESPSAQIEHYVQLRKWDKVLLAYDVELSFGNRTATGGLLSALQHSGLEYLLGAFVKTIDKADEDVDEWRYECAWRLSNWNMQLPEALNSQTDKYVNFENIASCNYAPYHYQALKCFQESDDNGLRLALDNARISVIKTLRNINLESCKTIYPALSQLQMLREIEELYFASPDTHHSVVEKWSNQDAINVDDFEYIEPILSQRAILLRTKKLIERNKVLSDALVDTYLQTSEVSAKHGYYQIAAKALGSLAKERDLSTDAMNKLRYHQATLAWMRDDHDIGRFLLRNLLVQDSLNSDMRIQALRVYGNWMAETKSENPQNIIKNYYVASMKCTPNIDDLTCSEKRNLLITQAALAQFADAQYQQIQAYMKSPQFESLKECIAYSHKTVLHLNSNSKDQDERKVAFITKKQNVNDKADLQNVELEKDTYLLLAVEFYVKTLQQGEDYNLLIFRLVSLWLDNTHHVKINDFLESHLQRIPSYKFILLVPQLAPHISDSTDGFSSKIYELLGRCAIEHPHHTLPVLMSLKNLHKDQKASNVQKSEPRILGATKLIDNLLTCKVAPIIREMDRLSHALIMLANWEPTKTDNIGNQQAIPKSHAIHTIKNLKHALVPTLSIDVKVNKVYDNIISIEKYAPVFSLVGGVNAPKKITCHGSDGIQRSQLVKGKDDLRQDAVMQQVFNVMNILLRTSKEANKRKLNVRTYKVVPLTQRSGVLQWCDNTLPVSIILEGDNSQVGLHQKYYPKDYSPHQCRKKLQDVCKKSNEMKLKVFMDCCKHLHPVFHYFFLEQFLTPEIWFERRLAYIHSVATTSIIGYILGLGDRHIKNILIDQSNAELIHIDFGVAFDQGKLLPTPETIPFRLTRDIEDAMGVSGIEGVFRRSCEETMTVLRSCREIVLTLLQVLLYDPLFTWVITPAEAYKHQLGDTQRSSEGGQTAVEINKLAERALLRLDQKLRGTEEGSASSVAGQVEQLIQQARDPLNLCRLFHGWQAYL